MIITAGKTNVSVYVYFVDDDGGTAPGEPTTGLLFSDIQTGGSASYVRQGAARVGLTLITLASASATHADGGFILVDDTNMPGLYRVDFPDAAFVTGADQVFIHLFAASGKNTVMRPVAIDITDVDLRDAVRGGMTALPNAAADAAGGLTISDAGGLDLDAQDTNINDIETDLANATDGLGALKTLIDTVNTDLSNGTDGLGALKTLIDTVNTDLSNGTDGLGALKTLIDTADTAIDVAVADLANGTDGLGALKTLIDTVNTDLSNGTDGLGALKTLIDTADTAIDVAVADLANGTDGLGALKTLIDTVNTDLSNGTDGLGALKTLIDALNDISTANVLTQVNTALDTAITELAVAVPSATPSLRNAAMLMYMALRNKLKVQTSGVDALEVHNDAGTLITKKLITDDGTDLTEAKMS